MPKGGDPSTTPEGWSPLDGEPYPLKRSCFAGEVRRIKPQGFFGGAALETRRSNDGHPGFRIDREERLDPRSLKFFVHDFALDHTERGSFSPVLESRGC